MKPRCKITNSDTESECLENTDTMSPEVRIHLSLKKVKLYIGGFQHHQDRRDNSVKIKNKVKVGT